MTKKSDAPAIRFKGFSDAWEQRKLGELVDRVVRKNINNESTLPLTISAQYGLVDQITYFNNRVASRDVSNYYLVLNGEFAYNKSTSDGYPFGAVKRLDLYEKGVLSTLYIVFAPKKEQQIDSDYLTVFFDTDRWHNGVAERAAEGARNHGLLNISAEDFFDIDLSVPKDIVEQKQIGAFIRQLDNLITLHQRQLFLHSTLDISLSVRLIHPFYTSSWEQRKLGEMGQTYTGLSGKTKDDFGHGQARFVTYMNVFSNPISNPEMTEPIEIDPKQNEVEVGDVFFTTSSETPEEVGMSSILLEKRGKTYLNSFCFGFRPSEKIDSYYLAYMLRSESTRAKIILLAQGISRYNISKNKVMEIAVSLPSLDEQKMIGQYFSQLDNLITLHQRKGKAAVSGCFLNCFSLEKSSAQSRTLELFGQISNQEIKYIIDGLSILGGKLRNFCVKLIILLSYTRINDIAKYHISRNTECVHNIN